MVEVRFVDWVEPGFSDFGFATLGSAGLDFERIPLAVADWELATSAAGGGQSVIELRFPGMRLRREGRKSVEPEPDYSEGA